MITIMILLMMMNIRTLFKELDRDHYKPIRTDSGFAEKNDNYIEYTSNADRYENLSPKEYPNVIRQYLRDLIDENKPIIIITIIIMIIIIITTTIIIIIVIIIAIIEQNEIFN